MDYKKFLGRTEEVVSPYFGGPYLDLPDRRVRVEEQKEPGFYRFAISGRKARALERVSAPDLEGYPAVRGHYASGFCFESGRREHELEFLDADRPAELAPVTARMLPGGYVLFSQTEFEGEAEDAARRALEEERSLEGISGVAAALRAAYAFALTVRVARGSSVPVAGRELGLHVTKIAEGGREAALALVADLEERRRHEALRRASLTALRDASRRRRSPARERDVIERVNELLTAAGATLLDLRPLGDGLDVTWRFSGQRIISLVQHETLRVIDAGFCLSGEDDLVTLDSLPSVLREAIETHALHVTRW